MENSSLKTRARQLRRALFLFALAGSVVSCQPYLFRYGDEARTIAQDNGFQEVAVDTKRFVLTTFIKVPRQKTEVVSVYIEGDGNAFTGSGRPSKDPTPGNAIGFRLAVRDPAQAVIYIARPCQFTKAWPGKGCGDNRYWTSHRFAGPVIESTNQVITRFKRQLSAEKIKIYGYSGGGAIAALVASRRNDIAALITVAGTLDHEYWTAHHDVTPLYGSENPTDRADRLKSINQWHFYGTEDSIMPSAVGRSYARKVLPPRKQNAVREIAGFDHQCCWDKVWPKLLNQMADAAR